MSQTPSKCQREERLALRLRLRWPTLASPALAENFFLGVWHATQPIEITWEQPAPGMPAVCRKGRNWFLLGRASPLHRENKALVHVSKDLRHGVAFRGYVLGSSIHSYSSSEDIVRYWASSEDREHNGVFSAAIVENFGVRLTLLSDVFGMGPLYYRTWKGAVLFSSNPRFLYISGDAPDYIAWRCRNRFIPSDRSLSLAVRRVPAGVALDFSAEGLKERQWFRFETLPLGESTVNDESAQEVEQALGRAMSRCLDIDNGDVILPLSSGYDSRRILAVLLRERVDFQSVTARALQKKLGFRDIDARFAAAMASDFGFPHQVVEMSEGEAYVADDIDRRLLLDAESGEHTWVVSLMRGLPSRPSIFLDGILGDILGNPGYRMSGLYESPEADLELIVRVALRGRFDAALGGSLWPSRGEVQDDIRRYLRPFLYRRNMAEFAFILLRQRRKTSLWSQQLLPAGHVVVCPYLDLDYIRLLLRFRPEDKHRAIFQRQCLERFWPELYKYHGTRDMPSELPPVMGAVDLERDLARSDRLRQETNCPDGRRQLKSLLSAKSRLMSDLARHSRFFHIRSLWYTVPLMEMVSREVNRSTCWEEV